MRKRWFPLFLLTASCSSTLGPGADAQFDIVANLGEPFDLKVGDQAFIRGTNLNVRFSKLVADSRCPSHALILCVWEGDGAILVESASSNFARLLDTLHTTLNPKTLDLGNVVLELLRLDPFPETTDPIPEEEYIARFVARSLGEP